MGSWRVQSFRHPFLVRERLESSYKQYFLMNINLVNNSNYHGVGSCMLHLQPDDLLGEDPTVSRSTIEDALSHMRVQSKYRRSIVEKMLSDARASAIAKALNLWVKVYIDISVLVHSDMEGMNSNMEEDDMDSDREEENMDSDMEEEEEEEFDWCSICEEEIVVGSKETRIPCTQMYHRDCIVKWLDSRFCSECRYGIIRQLMKPE